LRAHRPADDLELVVGLGEIDRDFRRRDRIDRGRQRHRPDQHSSIPA
jgi:hypothetical protein